MWVYFGRDRQVRAQQLGPAMPKEGSRRGRILAQALGEASLYASILRDSLSTQPYHTPHQSCHRTVSPMDFEWETFMYPLNFGDPPTAPPAVVTPIPTQQPPPDSQTTIRDLLSPTSLTAFLPCFTELCIRRRRVGACVADSRDVWCVCERLVLQGGSLKMLGDVPARQMGVMGVPEWWRSDLKECIRRFFCGHRW